MERIDRKFDIDVTCVAHGHRFSHDDGVFFKAADAAFNRQVLQTYKEECIKLGADPRHIACIDSLADRVMKFKDLYPELVKVPDVDPGFENDLVNKPND